MKKSIARVMLSAIASAVLLSVSALLSVTAEGVANAATSTHLPASMAILSPAILASSQDLGQIAPSTLWHIDLVLPSKNAAGLKVFASAVNHPGTPDYHQYLSHAQLISRFGPSATTLASLQSYLLSQHLNSRLSGQLLSVSGTVGQMNNLFHTHLTRYENHGRRFIAPDSSVTIPSALRAAIGMTGLYDALPVPGAITHPFSTNHLVQKVPSRQSKLPSGTETTASSGGMTLTAKLLSNASRTPGMAMRYLITATYNGQPDTSASYSSLSGSYQGASSLVNSSATNANGQFLLDFSLSQQQTVSLNLTVSDGVHQATVPLPAASFVGPSAATTSTLTLFGTPGQVIAPWNPSSNPVTRAFNATTLTGETAIHGPASLAVYTLGNVTSVSQSDVIHFAAQFGLPVPNVSVAYRGPNACSAANPACSASMVPIEEELSLDLQMMETSAPGSNIQIYEAGSLRSALNQVLTQDTAHVFSISYGEGEIPEQQYAATAQSSWDTLAQEANAEGITISISAGDSGAYEGALEGNPIPMLSYPANSPYVSSLGGLETSASPLGQINQNAMWGGNIGSELSRSTLISFLSLQNMIAGGGYSLIEPRPLYQQSFVPSNEGRGNPDYAFPASVVTPGYFAYFANVPFLFGGTSASAPLFAGWVGDLNLAAGHRLGNVNPRLYQLAANPNSPFLPVSYGNNGVYAVTQGRYNPVTGLGPINMDQLMTLLQNP